MELSLIDYTVFAIVICFSLGVGLFYAYKDRKKSYLLRYHRGDAKLKALPVALSLLVTKESSIFFLGYPAEIYGYGIQYILSSVAKSIGYLFIVYVSIPLYHPMGITSVYEYLGKRFGSSFLCRLTLFMDVFLMVIYSGFIIYGASVAVTAVTSLDAWIITIGLTSVAVVYTSLGGIKAVVFADVIQFLVMMISILAVLVLGIIRVGGIGNVIRLNMPTGRLKLFDFDPDPLVRNTFWSLMIGNIGGQFLFLSSQSTVQRLNSTRTVQDARKVMYIFIPCFLLIEILVMLQGLVAFAYFSDKGCDPLASGQIQNLNQIIPVTVVDMFSTVPGASGLFFAALCSASLSTISSMLSCMSAVMTLEFKNLFKSASETSITNYSRVLVIIMAGICVGFAILVGQVEGPLSQISVTITTSMSGPIYGVFILAIFTRSSSVKGVGLGALAGLVVGTWMAIGANFSSGNQRTPMLPLGPTSNCPMPINVADVQRNMTYNDLNTSKSLFENNTKHSYAFLPNSNASNEFSIALTTPTHIMQPVSGINRLYSISFNYFQIIVAAITVAVGSLCSRLLKRNDQDDVPESLTMSLSSVLFKCVCPLLKRSTETRYETTLTVDQEQQDG